MRYYPVSDWYWLAVGILIVWRTSHLLQAEDGPWQIVARLRRRAGPGMLGEMLDCFYCLSIWIALPVAFAVGDDVRHALLLWPALSGGAALLQRATAPTAAAYHEEPRGDSDVVLRKS